MTSVAVTDGGNAIVGVNVNRVDSTDVSTLTVSISDSALLGKFNVDAIYSLDDYASLSPLVISFDIIMVDLDSASEPSD